MQQISTLNTDSTRAINASTAINPPLLGGLYAGLEGQGLVQ